MGKIRVKTFDESSPEDDAKLKAKKEAKKAQKDLQKAHVSGMGGGQRVKTVGPTIEELEAVDAPSAKNVTSDDIASSSEVSENNPVIASDSAAISDKPAKKAKKEKFVKASKKTDSKRHKENLTLVSKTQKYSLDQAIEALKKFKKSKFDETVELHINTKEKGVNGQVTLPHGTGKTLVIKIADDAIIAEVTKGKINFDILVATPSMMPQLAKVARVLGPRGLMPNPKNGTITDKPEEAVKKLSGGQISYKTESDMPIIHAIVGKVSFEDNKLKDNVITFLSSVGTPNIANVTLKSTMSPAIRLDYSAFIK